MHQRLDLAQDVLSTYRPRSVDDLYTSLDCGTYTPSLSSLSDSTPSRLYNYITPRYRGIKDILSPGSNRLQWRRYIKRATWLGLTAILLALLAILVWLALIVTVVNRLRIPQPQNGLQRILQTQTAPNETHPAIPTWATDFSNGVIPAQCHSHNDYWHRVPLYEGLLAGCISTEADIWVGNTTDGHVDLYVGHNQRTLSPSRTLQSLYLGPLLDILIQQNTVLSNHPSILANTTRVASQSPIGVFSMAPSMSLILLLDFKTTGTATWDAVMSQLDPLRRKGWLTNWSPANGVIERPVTIVASGAAPFDLITSNTTYRDVFFDAPLSQLLDASSPYNSNNSYYASVSLGDAVGSIPFLDMQEQQKSRIATQVQKANELGLKSRYWDTPSWPVGWRNRIWSILVEQGASVLNVDDLTAAARWDWQMCIIGGLNICNI